MRWVLQNIRKRKSKKNEMRHKNNRWTMNRTKGWKQISILRHSCIPELMNPSDWYGRWIEFFFSSPPDSEQQHHWTAVIQPHNHNPATLIHYSTEWLLVSSLNLLEKKKNLYSISSGSLAVCVCVRERMFVCMRVSVCVCGWAIFTVLKHLTYSSSFSSGFSSSGTGRLKTSETN